MHNLSQGSDNMSRRVTRSQSRSARETSLSADAGTVISSTAGSNSKTGSPAESAKKEERATEDGLTWAPTPRQYDFTIEAKDGVMVCCHKDILKENSTFFKDSLKKSSKRFKVCYDAQTVKAFLDYFYNNNEPAATPELWQMSLKLGADDLTSDLAQHFSKVV